MRDELFKHKPDFDLKEMCIERAYRLGSLNNDAYRDKSNPKQPIIVRFKDYDTELVMEQTYRLRGSAFSLDRDDPKEISQSRKDLYSSNEAKERGSEDS